MTPHTRGIHVTGFVSCRRIFQMSVVSDEAPLTPRSCRTSADPSETSRLDLGGTASRRVAAVERVDASVGRE